MKNKIKQLCAWFVYQLYSHKILKNKLKVMSVDDTIDEMISSNKSLVRFGDGEIVILKGKDLKLQKSSPEITKGIERLLGYQHDDLLVTVQGIFDGVEAYQPNSRKFWMDHLLFCRQIYYKYCNLSKTYGDTAISRCYYAFEDKSKCKEWFNKIRQIWANQKIVVVEGEKTHNGVGNDLLDRAISVERIICPSHDAYEVKNEIVERCLLFPKDYVFLVSLGVAAKFVVEDLFSNGYRAIDIGNLDMEYEWYLCGSVTKMEIPKHSIVGDEANRKAGYSDYLNQIVDRIQPRI